MSKPSDYDGRRPEPPYPTDADRDEDLNDLKAQLAESERALAESRAATDRIGEEWDVSSRLRGAEIDVISARLAAMTAERDALRGQQALVPPLPFPAILAAERERERAKVVAYLRVTPRAGGVLLPILMSQAVARLADDIERGEHRPPAEPKPGDGEGK